MENEQGMQKSYEAGRYSKPLHNDGRRKDKNIVFMKMGFFFRQANAAGKEEGEFGEEKDDKECAYFPLICLVWLIRSLLSFSSYFLSTPTITHHTAEFREG